MAEILNLFGGLVHQLQKERGSVILFLGNKDDRFASQIKTQFNATDKAFAKLRNAVQEPGPPDKLFDKRLAALELAEPLKSKRETIQDRSAATAQLLNFYTYDLIAVLLNMTVEMALLDETNNPAHVSAYTNFIHWKEATGQERALGLHGLLGNQFDNQAFIERLRSLVSEQECYEHTFLALATDKQQQCYQNVMDSQQVLLARIDSLHQNIEQETRANLTDRMSAEEWYQLMTLKIDLMQKVVEKLTATLKHCDQPAAPDNQNKPLTVSGIAQPDRLNPRHKSFIKNLPLFANLPEQIFDALLVHAQIRDYQKGALLFLESEPATRLYIVLDGWVKLFKGTVTGEETILHMLSAGDMVVESAVFLGASYPVSAQIAEQATLLTIPAPIIRERIKNHNELAINMLTGMSHYSQKLIHQIEVTRLKSATERVGWFLLKLLLEQKSATGVIELPYDKSMIASYLDMKPETFSRTLKNFRDRGFEIRNGQIVVPEFTALCGYCNMESAAACSRHGTPDCPNPTCIEEMID